MTYDSNGRPVKNTNYYPSFTHVRKGVYKLVFRNNISDCLCFANVTRCTSGQFYVAASVGYSTDVQFMIADDASLNDLDDVPNQSARVQFALFRFDNLFNLY